MIVFHLDGTSGVATYLQLVQQVRQALQPGLLKPGDRLPTAQQVVAKLAINPNTVHKAYRDLEREGLVQARPGLGTFVVGTLPRIDPRTQARLPASITAWLRKAGRPAWPPRTSRRSIARRSATASWRRRALGSGWRPAKSERDARLLLACHRELRPPRELPAARHCWQLQWFELPIFLAASVALSALSFWWVRRRSG
jgi:GntR family transcriptional regulator